MPNIFSFKMPNIFRMAVESEELPAPRWMAVNTPDKSNPDPEPSAIPNPAEDTENPSKGPKRRKFARDPTTPTTDTPAPVSPETPTRRLDFHQTPGKRLFFSHVLIPPKDTQAPTPTTDMAAPDKGKNPETPKKKLYLNAAQYKPLLGFGDDNAHHYTIFRSDIVSYMRMYRIRGTVNPSAEAWARLTRWAKRHDSFVLFRALHSKEEEQVERAISSILRDCVHQVQQSETRLRKELVEMGMIPKAKVLTAAAKGAATTFEERAVRVIICDPDRWASNPEVDAVYQWHGQPGVAGNWAGVIKVPTFGECLRVISRRLPRGRVPRRIFGAIEDATDDSSREDPASVILADDEDVAGWLGQTRGLAALRMLVILHRPPGGDTDTPPNEIEGSYLTAELLVKALARLIVEQGFDGGLDFVEGEDVEDLDADARAEELMEEEDLAGGSSSK